VPFWCFRYYEDLPEDEIARVLGCAGGTVRSLATRVFGQLDDLALTLPYPTQN
jgi:DNA-directed RNA polymerase specialized sigma24 family protein